MMTSQSLKFVDSSKTQKHKYLDNGTLLFSSNKKKFMNYLLYSLVKNSFLSESPVTFCVTS